ncbi:hypothetical protein DYD21_18195 [Rhodohalobacter sp. SW132]|nr:hypothetical protein DYD21_18195 [Rhodohalobacter sp. SW132]
MMGRLREEKMTGDGGPGTEFHITAVRGAAVYWFDCCVLCAALPFQRSLSPRLPRAFSRGAQPRGLLVIGGNSKKTVAQDGSKNGEMSRLHT